MSKEKKQTTKAKQKKRKTGLEVEKIDLRNIRSKTTLPKFSEELEEKRALLPPAELAAFLIGTSWPDWSYERIAAEVKITSRTLYEWRRGEEFQKSVERYGQEYINKQWLPMKRAQIVKALQGDTFAFGALAKVEGKVIDRQIRAEGTVSAEVLRLLAMSDEELKAHIGALKAKEGGGDVVPIV